MRRGFLWLFLPSLPRAVNSNQMLMPHEISRMRSLFAIIRHPRNCFSKAGCVSCLLWSLGSSRHMSAERPSVKMLLQVLASIRSAQTERLVGQGRLVLRERGVGIAERSCLQTPSGTLRMPESAPSLGSPRGQLMFKWDLGAELPQSRGRGFHGFFVDV